MSDAAYTNALAKKARLLKELEEINGFLKLYQKFTPKTAVGDQGGAATSKPSASPKYEIDDNVSPPPKRESVPDRFSPIIRRVLLLAGRPLPRGELLVALKDSGDPVPGDNPSKNLGTILWRLRDKIVNVGGHGYWLADVAFPEGGYEPEGTKSLNAAKEEDFLS